MNEREDTTKTPIHIWYRCHGCEAQPIVGRRWECQTCPAGPDHDLCGECYRRFQLGELEHPSAESFAAGFDLGEHVFEAFEGEPAGPYRGWLEVPCPELPAPAVPPGFVLRPEFQSEAGSCLGSYAFAVEIEGAPAPLVLTALHVLDELIRKRGIDARGDDYTGRELPAVLSRVQLYDPFAERWFLSDLGTAGPMLILPGARMGDDEPDSHRDAAAFWAAGNGEIRPGRLAEESPAVGAPVWLAARATSGDPRAPLPAVVVASGEKRLVFRFADAEREAPYSSGSPLLDREGKVVGINVGGGALGGERLGHACHVGALRRHIAQGLELSPPPKAA